MCSGVTTGLANPASEGAAPKGSTILKICSKNWQINVPINEGRRTKKLQKHRTVCLIDGRRTKNYRGR